MIGIVLCDAAQDEFTTYWKRSQALYLNYMNILNRLLATRDITELGWFNCYIQMEEL